MDTSKSIFELQQAFELEKQAFELEKQAFENEKQVFELEKQRQSSQQTTANTDYATIVDEMKIRESKNKKDILGKIKMQPTLTGKCLYARYYLSPQSTELEIICKTDLNIGEPINSTSGDGHKNGINYEIKASVHAKESRINFVQIRPDHNVDYYIFIAYNMFDTPHGNGHIFKIPSNIVYELIVRYGGYAHGTREVFGEITLDNIKGRNCEYALRCDPNSKKGKSFELWNELMKYKVEYNSENF